MRPTLISQFCTYYQDNPKTAAEYFRQVKEGDIIAVYYNNVVIHYAYVYEVLQMHEPVPMCYHIHRLSSGYWKGLLYKQPLLTILADKKTFPDFDINRLSHSELKLNAKCFMLIDNQDDLARRLQLVPRSETSRQNLHKILEAYYQLIQVFDYHVLTKNCEHLATNWRYESRDKNKSKAWSRQTFLYRRSKAIRFIVQDSLFFPKLDYKEDNELLSPFIKLLAEIKKKPTTRDLIARPSLFQKWISSHVQDCFDPSDHFTKAYENPYELNESRLEDLKFAGTVLVLQSSISKDRVSEYKRRQCYNPEHEIPAPGETTSYLRDVADINVVVKLLKNNTQIKVFIWEADFNCYLKKPWPSAKYKIIGNALKKYCPNLEHISVMHYEDGEKQFFAPFLNSESCKKIKCIDCSEISLKLIQSCSKKLDFLGCDVKDETSIKFAISNHEVAKLSSRHIDAALISPFVETLCETGKKVTFLDVFASYTSEQTSKIATSLRSLTHLTVKGIPSVIMQDLHKIEKLNSLYWVADFGPKRSDDKTSQVHGWPESERQIALQTFKQIGGKLTSLQIKKMPTDMDFFEQVLKSCPHLHVLRITLDSKRMGSLVYRVMKFGPILEKLSATLTDLDLDGQWIDDGEYDLLKQLEKATTLRYIKVTNADPSSDSTNNDDPKAIYNKIRFFCCFGLNDKLEVIFEKFEEN